MHHLKQLKVCMCCLTDIYPLWILPHFHFEKAEVEIQMVVNEIRFVMFQYNTNVWSIYVHVCFTYKPYFSDWVNKTYHFPAWLCFL